MFYSEILNELPKTYQRMFRKRKVLWYIGGTYMCNILIGSILKSILDSNVMIFCHNYAGDAHNSPETLWSHHIW